LIAEHGKDLQHAVGENPSSGFTAPKYLSNKNTVAQPSESSSSSGTATATTAGHVNVTTLTDSAEFRTSADELYQTFTDPQRLAAFTRAPPKVFEGANPGARFELFGGNVSGSYEKLDPPKSIVQKWRLAQWPAGHFSTLKLDFDQNDVDHVTVMRVTWEGVPIGQEDVAKRNWNEYYVRSIKTTFGFGTVL
jgi:activator of HSP90 ATPase